MATTRAFTGNGESDSYNDVKDILHPLGIILNQGLDVQHLQRPIPETGTSEYEGNLLIFRVCLNDTQINRLPL